MVRDLGIPDSNIILMNSLDVAYDTRNPKQGSVSSETSNHDNSLLNELYNNVQFDFTGNEVTVDNFIRLLTNRQHRGYNHHKSLNTNEHSNILLFMSGHGGDEFFKFNDHEELSAEDIGHVFTEMYIKKRYKEIMFIIDTCQASTLANHITSPNIITIASSRKGENSYSYINSDVIGAALIDRFSYSIQHFFNQYIIKNGNKRINTDRSTMIKQYMKYNISRELTFQHLIDSMDPRFLRSSVTVIQSPQTRECADIPLLDYFSSMQSHKYLPDACTSYDIDESSKYDHIELIDMDETQDDEELFV